MASDPQPMFAKPAGAADVGSRAAGQLTAKAPRLDPGADPGAVVDEILSLLSQERFRTARSLAAEAIADTLDELMDAVGSKSFSKEPLAVRIDD